MVLQLNLAGGVDRLAVVPVVLHGHVVDDQFAVEVDRDLVPDHDDPDCVPLADGLVRDLRRFARVLLVVVEAAGTNLSADRRACGVPDLHLRCASQVDAAVAVLLDLPVDEHLEIAVVLGRAQTAALAVENEDAVLDLPVCPHVVVGFLLELGQLVAGQGGPFVGIVVRPFEQSLPAGQIFAVEQGFEPLRRLVQRLRVQGAGGQQDDQGRRCESQSGVESSAFHRGSSFPCLCAPWAPYRLVPCRTRNAQATFTDESLRRDIVSVKVAGPRSGTRPPGRGKCPLPFTCGGRTMQS